MRYPQKRVDKKLGIPREKNGKHDEGSLGQTIAIVAVGIVIAAPVFAQTYPDRTVEIINPYTLGGATDIMGRALMDGLASELKSRFVSQ